MSELISGTNVVKAAIEKRIKFNNLYILSTNKEMQNFASNNNYKYEKVDKDFLEKLQKNNQGVVARIEDFKLYNLEDIIRKDSRSLIIILEGLEDPHNLGAILRTADASGADGVIIPKNRSVKLNSTVAKVSTGAIFNVKTVEVVNLVQTIDKLKKAGYWIVGAEKTKDSVLYSSLNYDFPTVLIIGSEGKGISRLVKEQCDYLVEIPMKGIINSLNASVACGIMVYEIIKNKK